MDSCSLKAIRAWVLGLSVLGAGSAVPLAGQTFTDFPVSGGYPAAIASGPDGNLWFTEPAGDKIGRITTAGAITEFPVPSQFSPYGIVPGPGGSLWFTQQVGAIGRITPAGVVTQFPIPDQGFPRLNPTGIAVGSDGNLWFTEEAVSWIGRMTPTGIVTHFPLNYSGPFGLTPGPDGNLWFTVRASGESKICKITTGGVSTAYGDYGQLDN